MILENGTIRTMDEALPTTRALAVAGDRVAGGIGTTELALPSPERVDLGGRCVLPGFTDAHVHFPSWALARQQVQLETCSTLAEALDRVGRHAAATETDWVRGGGWRTGDWQQATDPTSDDLDQVVSDRPAALTSRDGHSLWLNSKALVLASGELDAVGGIVERDGAGNPTGVLREQAAWQFRDRFLTVDDADVRDAMAEGIRVAHARGLVAVHDKDGGQRALEHWQALAARRKLSLRVWQSLPVDRVKELQELGVRSGFGDDFLRVGYLKVFMDGALGSATAWRLDGSGTQLLERESLAEIVREAAAAGFPVAVHAIGDAANREALAGLADSRAAWNDRGLRPRIEHAQLLDPDDLPRFAELGVAASVQFSHAPTDRELADAAWPNHQGAYAYRSLAETGALLVNGSDAPVEPLNPWGGVCAGVNRTLDSRPGWRTEQALTIQQALAATTVAAPWLEGAEHRRGRLIPGMLADLVVVDRDPFSVPAEQLPSITIVATMVGGRWVHNPPPWN